MLKVKLRLESDAASDTSSEDSCKEPAAEANPTENLTGAQRNISPP